MTAHRPEFLAESTAGWCGHYHRSPRAADRCLGEREGRVVVQHYVGTWYRAPIVELHGEFCIATAGNVQRAYHYRTGDPAPISEVLK